MPPLDVDRHFKLGPILSSAQDFRWRCWSDKEGYFWYSGVLAGNLIHIRQIKDRVEYKAKTDLDDSELRKLLESYFRLDEDLDSIHSTLAEYDDLMACLVEKYPHLRILRQPDEWECLVSYICSPVVETGTVKRHVDRIARKLGSQIELDGDERHAFPDPTRVLRSKEQLRKLSFRFNKTKEYIVAAAERISECRLDLVELAKPCTSYEKAVGQLRRPAANGIGPKIANCVALFALDKMEAFPVDSNIGQALSKWYNSSVPQPKNWKDVQDREHREIVQWAQDRFGKYAGHANQLLFQAQWDSD